MAPAEALAASEGVLRPEAVPLPLPPMPPRELPLQHPLTLAVPAEGEAVPAAAGRAHAVGGALMLGTEVPLLLELAAVVAEAQADAGALIDGPLFDPVPLLLGEPLSVKRLLVEVVRLEEAQELRSPVALAGAVAGALALAVPVARMLRLAASASEGEAVSVTAGVGVWASEGGGVAELGQERVGVDERSGVDEEHVVGGSERDGVGEGEDEVEPPPPPPPLLGLARMLPEGRAQALGEGE